MSRRNQGAAESRREKRADVIDRYVGSRIRLRRRMLGVSQGSLAASLGVSSQQVQKYETGVSRICAGRLHRTACALEAPVSFFFPQSQDRRAALDGEASSAAIELASSADAIELSLAAMRIADPKVRRRIIELVRTIAAQSDEGPPPG